jgi:DNA repair exonuclease SbcCD ATPase subunit
MEEQSDQGSAIDSLGTAFKSEFDQLRQQNNARLEQLSTLMSALEACTEATSKEGEALHTITETGMERINSLQSELGSNAERSASLERRVEELATALSAAEQLNTELSEKAQSADTEHAGLEAAQSELATRTSALEAAQAEANAKTEELVSVRSELSAKVEELDAVGAELAGQSEALGAAQPELSAKTEALAALQHQFDELTQAHDQEHDVLKSALERASAAEQKLGELEAESANTSEMTSVLEERSEALQATLDSKEAALQESQASLESAREELQRTTEELETLSSAQDDATAAQDGLKTELLSVQREMEGLREKYREGLSTEAALALRQQVTETAARVQQVEGELEEARGQTKKSVLAQQLAEAIEDSERVGEENNALRQELSLLRDGKAMQESEAPDDSGSVASGVTEPAHASDDELRRIDESAKKHANGPKRVIGQILLDAGVVTEEGLDQALALQKSNPQQHMGSILTELGLASEEAVAQARASQCGVEFIRFNEDTVNPEAAALVTERLAKQHNCIPVSVSNGEMLLAVTNPMDLMAIEDVERFTSTRVEVVVGTAPEITAAIAKYYWEPE